jgi:hypothetical protein
MPLAVRAKILIAGVTLCLQGGVCAAPAPSASAGRTSRWQADLDYFAKALPAGHKDFYALMPRERFEHEITDLRRAVPQLPDSEIILRLDRLVASLRVAHTQVSMSSGLGARAFHRYPIRMSWFADDLAVVAAAPAYREALGCRVVRVGSLTPDQAEAAVAPYISYENRAHLRHASPRYLVLVELMQHERIADAADHLRLTCAKPDGKEFTLDLPPSGLAGANRESREAGEAEPESPGRAQPGRKLVSAEKALRIPPLFCHKHQHPPYWFEYLPDTQALYIQYNLCRDSPTNSFGPFVKKLLAVAGSQPVRRVVVDLRFNGGGSSSVVNPLLQGLRVRPALSAKGHLYVLTGSGTYSSAMITAHKFRAQLNAILVGEAPGNKPNHYGDVRSFLLPNSKLKVAYASKHIRLMRDADPESLEPDIVVPNTLADYLAGRDRILETALGQERRAKR